MVSHFKIQSTLEVKIDKDIGVCRLLPVHLNLDRKRLGKKNGQGIQITQHEIISTFLLVKDY